MSRTRIFKVSEMTETDILSAARALDEGAVSVVPTDTVYGSAREPFAKSLFCAFIKSRRVLPPVRFKF